MSPMRAFKSGLTGVLKFSGRTQRSEFAIWVALGFIACFLIGLRPGNLTYSTVSDSMLNAFFWFPLFGLVGMPALGVRRMHDIGLTGRFWIAAMVVGTLWSAAVALHLLPYESGLLIVLFMLAPFVSVFAMIPCLLPSQTGENRFGPNPNEVPS